MPDVTVNAPTLVFAMIIFALLVLAFTIYRSVDKRLIARGEREIHDTFQPQVNSHSRQAWDGETYAYQQWPEQGLSQYLENQARALDPAEATTAWPAMAAGRPRPVSAPMPALDAEAETDLFIAQMRENTDLWIGYYSQAELAGV